MSTDKQKEAPPALAVATGSVTKSDSIRFEDADPTKPLKREEMLWIDATPDADYPLRILRAYLRNTTMRTISEPPMLGEIMNKAQDERAVILQDAINRLTASQNAGGVPRPESAPTPKPQTPESL